MALNILIFSFYLKFGKLKAINEESKVPDDNDNSKFLLEVL